MKWKFIKYYEHGYALWKHQAGYRECFFITVNPNKLKKKSS